MHGFPNCFILGNAQQAITPNFTYLHTALSRHIAFIVSQARARGIRAMEATPEAAEAWVDTVMSFGRMRQRLQQACTPSYINNDGQITDLNIPPASHLGGESE